MTENIKRTGWVCINRTYAYVGHAIKARPIATPTTAPEWSALQVALTEGRVWVTDVREGAGAA